MRSSINKEDVVTHLDALQNTVEAKDPAGFIKSHKDLTNNCNAYHQSVGRDFINVQVPASSPFVDQDFDDRIAEGRRLVQAICGICHVVPGKPNVPLGLRFEAPSFAELGAPTVLLRSQPASASGIRPQARRSLQGNAESPIE
jgi:hypothetical protein